MKFKMSEKIKSRDHEGEILKYIKEKPTGVTIAELSKKKGFSRNTISKYVSLLVLKKLIFKKKIGAYHLYFSPEIKFFSKMYSLSCYKALLAGLKRNYPNDGDVFKEIGRESLKYFDFILKPSSSEKLRSIRYNRILKLYYDVFGKFSTSLNIIQPKIELFRKKGGKNDKLILKFTNSEFLDDSNDFIYHFYISAGMIEAIWKREVNKNVKCDIETIHISDKKENSFIELSIEIDSS